MKSNKLVSKREKKKQVEISSRIVENCELGEVLEEQERCFGSSIATFGRCFFFVGSDRGTLAVNSE